MAISLRSIEQALAGGGWPTNKVNSLNDTRPTILQNYIAGASNTVNNSTTLADAVQQSTAGFILGNCLMLELGETNGLSFNNYWLIRAYGGCTTSAAAGLALQMSTYDGLSVTSGQGGFMYEFNTATANIGVNAAVNATASSGAVNVVSFTATGLVQIQGYGRIGLQFSQAVATAVVTRLTPFSYIEATAILA